MLFFINHILTLLIILHLFIFATGFPYGVTTPAGWYLQWKCCQSQTKLSLALQNWLDWLVVLEFNATLTAKVISWLSVKHMFFLAFSHSTNTTFISKATDYFSRMLLQRWEAKIRRKESSSQPGIELTALRWWLQHVHHWATRARRFCNAKGV